MNITKLNSKYDHVRVQILGKERLPQLNEMISLSRGKDS